jgi:hypothetical protein
MKGYLLDMNLLIALLWLGRRRHELALHWFSQRRVTEPKSPGRNALETVM